MNIENYKIVNKHLEDCVNGINKKILNKHMLNFYFPKINKFELGEYVSMPHLENLDTLKILILTEHYL